MLRAFIDEEYRESFVEIYEAEAEERLVTRIEVLSPSNKRFGTKGWKLYQIGVTQPSEGAYLVWRGTS